MQGKGIIKFFIIALIVVCLFQLTFSLISWRVQTKADDYATEKVLAEGKKVSDFTNDVERDSVEAEVASFRRRYLDSVSKENVVDLGLIQFTYEDVKKQQIKLGLDLKGGMSVVLQVSVEDIIKAMSNYSKDSTFNKALVLAKERQKDTQENFVTVFGQEFQRLDPNAKLAGIFATPENADLVSYNSTNEEVLRVLDAQAKANVSMTYSTLRSRIDAFGVVSPNINLQESTGRIIIELPGVENPEELRKIFVSTAKLEFWETYQVSEVIGRMADANKVLVGILGLTDTAATPLDPNAAATQDSLLGLNAAPAATLTSDSAIAGTDTTKLGDTTALDNLLENQESDSVKANEEFATQNPLFAVLIPPVDQTGNLVVSPNDATVGFARPGDRKKVDRYLAYEQVRALFPKDMKLLWGAKANSNGFFPLYAIKTQPNEDRAPLEGDVIKDATQDINQNQGISEVVVDMVMNSEGAKKWKRLTSANAPKSANERGKCIAIVMDDVVYTAPEVRSEIPNGRSQITGNFTIAEAKALASVIKAGKLPAPARIVEEEIVGPTLGQKSINAGLTSLALGLVAVLAFMILYYTTSGLIADIAVIMNLFFMMGVLASYGASLTLPGMAGIILSLGMAVDANVIINERIREELAKGKGLRLAIQDGFSNSYSAIIDGNVTTLITGFILLFFGLGPVKGFATTLVIGLFTSFITAVLVSRLIFDWCLEKDVKLKFATKLTEGAFKGANYAFVANRKMAYIFVGIISVAGLASIFIKGFDLGVDFKGGRTYIVRFDKDVQPEPIAKALEAKFAQYPQVKNYGGGDQVSITTAYLIEDDAPATDSIVEMALYEGVKGFYGSEPTYEKFHSDYKQSSIKVGPSIADDIKAGAFQAAIFAVLGIFIYIYFRFNRKWQYGLGAVAALAFNALFLLTVYSIFGGLLPFSTEIDQTFIAALLTVLGYSVNDTVVVFDRIREYLGLHPTKDFKGVVNMAINDTLSRTVVTGLTTLLVILILMIFGGEVIRGFCFALMVGIIVGTFSSIFVATPIVVDLQKDEVKK